MTCRPTKNKSDLSRVQVPSRPPDFDNKIDDLIGFVFGAILVVGVVLLLTGLLLLFEGRITAGTITGMVGVFITYYGFGVSHA